MDRIFHARVPWHTVVFLILLTVVTLWAFWIKLIIPAVGGLLLIVILIERIIHTTYTITQDKRLVVFRGRFSRALNIPLEEIRRIEKLRSAKMGSVHLADYLIIYYGKEGDEKSLSLQPDKEEEFVECIRKRRGE